LAKQSIKKKNRFVTILNTSQALKLPRALHGFSHIKRYWDKTNDSFVAKILPGELYVTCSNEIITTVLGSCISACIRDPIFGIGGMNHFMLPMSTTDTSQNDKLGSAMRYGNYAMEHLINEILKNGGERSNLEVKLFGGGRVLSHMTDVGERNIKFALEYIATEGLKLIAEDLGDIYPRKIQYNPITGKARQKKLRNMHNRTIVQREEAYMQDIDQTPVSGDVELF
jgi:chemotaxis protein CheD